MSSDPLQRFDLDYATLHVSSSDVPFASVLGIDAPMSTRVLHARPSEGFIVTQMRARPFGKSALHVHHAPAFGWTNSGMWGHDEHFGYVAGTYIFEAPGVPHRFFAGPEPVDAFFVTYGDVHVLDPETNEVTDVLSPSTLLERYLEACEECGVIRPNVLG